MAAVTVLVAMGRDLELGMTRENFVEKYREHVDPKVLALYEDGMITASDCASHTINKIASECAA